MRSIASACDAVRASNKCMPQMQKAEGLREGTQRASLGFWLPLGYRL